MQPRRRHDDKLIVGIIFTALGLFAAAMVALLIMMPRPAFSQGFPVPQECLPAGLTPTATGTPLIAAANEKGIAWAYHCDYNHQWTRYAAVIFWNQVPDADLAKIKAAFVGRDLAAFQAYWQKIRCAVSTPDCCPINETNCKYNELKPLLLSIPWPSAMVPSGLVTQTPDVYKQRFAVDGYTWVKIGTAPLGTRCDHTKRTDNYFPINRTAVTMTSKFDVKPLLVYGVC